MGPLANIILFVLFLFALGWISGALARAAGFGRHEAKPSFLETTAFGFLVLLLGSPAWLCLMMIALWIFHPRFSAGVAVPAIILFGGVAYFTLRFFLPKRISRQ